MEHRLIPLSERHPPHSIEFANSTERLAYSGSLPLQSLALQVDDGSYWRLTNTNPVTWVWVNRTDYQAPLVSGSNIKTINGISILGPGDIETVIAISAIKTANYTAKNGEVVRVDTTAGSFTVTLPATPIDGSVIKILDVPGSCGSNPVTVEPGAGATIEGDSGGLSIDTASACVELIYSANTLKWELMDVYVTSSYQVPLVSGGNIKTVANQSILGPGNINISTVEQPVNYTYTGTLAYPPYGLVTTPNPILPSGNQLVNQLFIPPANGRLTSLELTDLEAIDNAQLNSNTGANFQSLPRLTTLSFPVLARVTSGLTVANCLSLTTLSLPLLKYVGGGLSCSYLGATSLSFPELEFANSVVFGNLTALTSVSFPKLKAANTLSINLIATLTGLSFPSLETVFTTMTLGGTSVGSISLPSLVTVGYGLTFTGSNAITTITVPELKVVGDAITVSNCPALTSFSVPKIESIGQSFMSAYDVIAITTNCAALTSFQLPNTLKQVGGASTANGFGNVTITSCALDQASVDNILVTLASLDGTNGTSNFASRSVTITGTSATPSATGLTAKATLQARGCTVTTN